MKSTLLMLVAIVALVAVLGPPTLDVIKGTPNAEAGRADGGEKAEGKATSAEGRKDGKRRKSDDDDD